jgi:2,4-dienoyl-CoA reductase-like NADH-dependent reductase (Old Yellow Enzyme family)
METTMSDALDKCFEPAHINGLTLRNRFIKAATWEGKTPDGIPSQNLTDWHVELGEGGIGMTTIAYCASEADGRVDDQMMYMGDHIRPQLSDTISAIHATGAAVSGQLAHCGTFTSNKSYKGSWRLQGPSKGINTSGIGRGLFLIKEMNKQEIAQRVQSFATAAAFMKSVGFDAIEIHFGHGYGISQFISPITNKRSDEYGGSLQNRMRLPVEVLEAVRGAVGDEFPILGKISMSDGVRGGIHWDDSLKIASTLDKAGIDALICSAGTSSMNPQMLFRGGSLLDGVVANQKNPIMKAGIRMMGEKLFKHYPYEDLYLLEHAQRIRDQVDCKMVYVGGASGNDNFAELMTRGFDFIQLARALVYDPALVNNARTQSDYRNNCDHCNRCATMNGQPGGVRCVVKYPIEA